MADETTNEIISLTGGLTEAVIDSFLSEGLFKEIPIIGSIISVGKLTQTFVDRLFLNRILTFIYALDIKSEKEIEEVKEKYFKDSDYKEIGSKILFCLEKIDDNKKVNWLAKSFRMFLDGKVERKQFLRISSIINNAFVSDVEQMVVFNKETKIVTNNKFIDSYVLDHLYSIGLLSNIGFDGGRLTDENSGGTIFCLNEFGEIFAKELISP